MLSRRAFVAASAGIALGGCGSRRAPKAEVPADVLAFHRESAVFDLHIDTLLWQRFLGYDLTAAHESLLPFSAFAWHMDLPRARQGGLDGAVLGIVVTPRRERPEQLWALKLLARLERGRGLPQTLETLDLLAAIAREHPDQLVFARSGSELRAAVASGRFAALAGLEGAHGLEDSLDGLRAAWERGLRLVGLAHFQASGAAYPMTEPSFDDRGLTPFGFDLVAEMDALHMVVDLAHVGARGVDDALGALKRPFVVSHSACRAVHQSRRNLSDAQIRAVAERGGVIGIAVGRSFLGPGGIDAFVAHAEHARSVGGEGVVALGSDWDGAIVPAPGLEDVRSLPRLCQALLSRSWKPEAVRGLLGDNALRVLTAVLG